MKPTVETNRQPDGTRVVVTRYDGSWTRYVVFPRELVLRWLRQAKRTKHPMYTLFDLPGINVWIRAAGYGGPGQAFAREPVRMRSSRRFVVIAQSGGWDV